MQNQEYAKIHSTALTETTVEVTHEISSVEKLMMVGMKFSLMSMDLMERQSVVGSPISRQMLSMAILTALGGLARERTSTNCCFLIDLTAIERKLEVAI
jgi:hypothetical protein